MHVRHLFSLLLPTYFWYWVPRICPYDLWTLFWIMIFGIISNGLTRHTRDCKPLKSIKMHLHLNISLAKYPKYSFLNANSHGDTGWKKTRILTDYNEKVLPNFTKEHDQVTVLQAFSNGLERVNENEGPWSWNKHHLLYSKTTSDYIRL